MRSGPGSIGAVDHTGDSTVLTLAGPFEVAPAMAMLASTSIPGSEITDLESSSHTRHLTLPASGPTLVTVRLERDRVTLEHAGSSGSELAHIVADVRAWLDLDAEPGVIQAALGHDPVIGPLVRSRPGLRVIGYPNGFEAVVMTILGQQVSVAAARTFGGRAVAAFGGPSSGDAGLRPFPSAETLAAVPPTELQAAIGVTHSRARSVHALATVCAGGLVIDAGADSPALRRELLALPGIGPWTVDLLAVRVLGDRDGYPSGDLVLQRALRVGSAAEARAAAVGWTPFRAYALFHLWSHALGI